MPIANDLVDEYTRYDIDVSRYIESNAIARIQGHLIRIRRAVRSSISDLALDEGTDRQKLLRLRAVQQQLNEILDRIYSDADKTLNEEAAALATLDSQSIPRILNRNVGVGFFDTGISQEIIDSIVSDFLVNGAPHSDWWSRQERKLMERFADTIRNSIFLGETGREVVIKLLGTRTQRKVTYRNSNGEVKRAAQFAGGILQTTEREATALVRTALLTVLQQARFELYKGNQDILNGYQSLTVLDSRTSKICISRSGTAWDLEGNPLGDTTIRFPGPPPWHYQCRTTLLPIIKSFEELADIQAGIPESQRRRLDGRIADDLTYNGWLKRQPVNMQRSILGPGAYNLWREGKLNLRQLVDASGKDRTLEQLRELYTR